MKVHGWLALVSAIVLGIAGYVWRAEPAAQRLRRLEAEREQWRGTVAVSYTHLTLPTIYSV